MGKAFEEFLLRNEGTVKPKTHKDNNKAGGYQRIFKKLGRQKQFASKRPTKGGKEFDRKRQATSL